MRVLVVTILIAGAAVASSVGLGEEYVLRTWTNDQGQTMEARLKRVSGRDALLDQDGETVRAPTNRLSEEDREWVNIVRQLNRWRDWTLADGSVVRAKLLSFTDGRLELDDRTETRTLTLDEISDADRELLAQVYEGLAPEEEVEAEADNTADFAREDFTGADTVVGAVTGEFVQPRPITRTWTDVNGRSIVAEFRGVKGNDIHLYFKDRDWWVAIDTFSRDDQLFVAEQLARFAAGEVASDDVGMDGSAGGSRFDQAQNDLYGRIAPGSVPADDDPENRFENDMADDFAADEADDSYAEDETDTMDQGADDYGMDEPDQLADTSDEDQGADGYDEGDEYDEYDDGYDEDLDAYAYDEGEEASGVSVLLSMAGFLLWAVGGIWFLIVAFGESVLWGLGCMFVPLVKLIFLAQHSEEAGIPFLIYIVGWMMLFASNFM